MGKQKFWEVLVTFLLILFAGNKDMCDFLFLCRWTFCSTPVFLHPVLQLWWGLGWTRSGLSALVLLFVGFLNSLSFFLFLDEK